MKKGLKRLICVLGGFSLLTGISARAEEGAAKLEEIVVTGDRLITPTKQTGETVYTGTEVTRKGIETEGNKGDVSVYHAIDALPGVSVEGIDPYGLDAEQKNVRIRGVRGYFGAMSVEGIPNWGGNPIGPRDYIYDTENFQGIAVYEGGVPGSLGTGVGDLAGTIELRPLWPQQQPGLNLSTSAGGNRYYREFLRVDTGKFQDTGTSASVSSSLTNADKWKGPGDLGPRKNVNVMVDQRAWGKDDVKFWFNYNEQKQDLYSALTYGQTQNLDTFYRLDYNKNLTGIKSLDINYYRYNHADLTNTDMLSVIPFTFNETYKLSFKPYLSLENSDILGGTASSGGIIQKRLRDIDRYGLLSEIEGNFEKVRATVGYLFEANDSKINVQNYNPVNFAYQGWGNYGENQGLGYLNSPYLKLAGQVRGLDWQTGVKYFNYSDPASLGYVWNSQTNSLVRATDLDRDAKDYSGFFPTFGLGHKFSDSLEIYGNYGRNFLRPYSYQPLITLYNANRPTFQKAGVTLDDMFKGYDITLSNDFDLGARYRIGWFETFPTLFYAKYSNLLTTVYDPRVNLSYQQNIGKATGAGVQIANNIYINDRFTLFVNPSFNSMKYDTNITYQGATLNAKNNQVIDTPEWMVKSGLIFKYGGFEITPIVRYVGDRYGDVQHQEHVPDYFLADLEVAYTWKNVWIAKSMKLSLQLQNLFDNKYVSVINASDDSRAGSTSYYVGAPFSGYVKLSMEF